MVDGAISSGPALLTTSVELAHPFTAALPSLWGAVFIDAGRAGSSFGSAVYRPLPPELLYLDEGGLARALEPFARVEGVDASLFQAGDRALATGGVGKAEAAPAAPVDRADGHALVA